MPYHIRSASDIWPSESSPNWTPDAAQCRRHHATCADRSPASAVGCDERWLSFWPTERSGSSGSASRSKRNSRLVCRTCQQRYRYHLEKNATQMAAISWRLTVMTVATCPASRLSACADGQVGSDEMRSAPTCPHDHCWRSLEECNPDASNDRATYRSAAPLHPSARAPPGMASNSRS